MERLNRWLSSTTAAARWLALPIAALLFLQWPLRDLVQNGSREANDAGQWMFAWFVAASVVAATRAGKHLGTDAVSTRYPPKVRRVIACLGVVCGVLPWAAFLLYASMPQILHSVLLVERFADTRNPGYFMIKLALGLLCVLVFAQAVLDLIQRDGAEATKPENGR